MDYTIHPIATIHTDFADKFGIPRQSGLVPELTARIVFEPEYRDPNALVGIEGYDRLWLIWQFSTVAAEYAAGSCPDGWQLYKQQPEQNRKCWKRADRSRSLRLCFPEDWSGGFSWSQNRKL